MAKDKPRFLLAKLVDPDLAPLVDAIRVVAEGHTVGVTGTPANFDVWKMLQGVLRTASSLTSQSP